MAPPRRRRRKAKIEKTTDEALEYLQKEVGCLKVILFWTPETNTWYAENELREFKGRGATAGKAIMNLARKIEEWRS